MRQVQSSLMFVALLAAGACSHSSSEPTSPTSPTVDLSSPAPSSSGATVGGQVQGSIRSPMTVSVLGTAKAAAVDYESLARFQADANLVDAEECLKDAFATDVRPVIRDWRCGNGLAEDPLRAHRESGYAGRIARERAEKNAAAVTSYA